MSDNEELGDFQELEDFFNLQQNPINLDSNDQQEHQMEIMPVPQAQEEEDEEYDSDERDSLISEGYFLRKGRQNRRENCFYPEPMKILIYEYPLKKFRCNEWCDLRKEIMSRPDTKFFLYSVENELFLKAGDFKLHSKESLAYGVDDSSYRGHFNMLFNPPNSGRHGKLKKDIDLQYVTSTAAIEFMKNWRFYSLHASALGSLVTVHIKHDFAINPNFPYAG